MALPLYIDALREIFAKAVIHPETGISMEYRALLKSDLHKRYIDANVTEIGCLTGGRVGGKGISPTKKMEFCYPYELPEGKTATYLRAVCNFRSQKDQQYRVRWTVGGGVVPYPDGTIYLVDINETHYWGSN